MQAVGREGVAKNVQSPQLFHTTRPSAPRPPPRGGPHTNKHLVSFVIADVWLLFFSKEVNFMVYLFRKYVCRSAVALVNTTFL